MEHKLLSEPEFDFDAFCATLNTWKTAGAQSINMDWSTGSGLTLAYYPSGNRKLAETWKTLATATRYSEEYADFIELKLLPRLVELIQSIGLQPLTRCVDQQPILVMRQRRRQIASVHRG